MAKPEPHPLFTSSAVCLSYIDSHDGRTIASHLRQDLRAAKSGRLPSVLALYLPRPGQPLADEISLYLGDQVDATGNPTGLVYPKVARRLIYSDSINQIKNVIGRPEDFRPSISKYHLNDQNPQRGNYSINPKDPDPDLPSSNDLTTALNVMKYLQSTTIHHSFKDLGPRTPLQKVINTLEFHLAASLPQFWADDGTTSGRKAESTVYPPPQPPPPPYHANKRKDCYICHLPISYSRSSVYPCLCPPCASFTLSSTALSSHDALDLRAHTALVTGGRINLGLHTALRLLHCEAHVIVSSRYPADAASYYHAEPDFKTWNGRIRVVGADFRSANDAFSLVRVVKGVLREWNRHLTILVNNAAQTLTDSDAAEKDACTREQRLLKEDEGTWLVVGKYSPRVKAGIGYSAPSRPSVMEDMERLEKGEDMDIDPAPISPTSPITPALELGTTLVRPLVKSSWRQNLAEIPYNDVISAHSVNALVPFILTRELLPLIASGPLPSDGERPRGYVINVTSREGHFEGSLKSKAKHGRHVHTNMSKAALDMLTHTEARPAWENHRVAVNSVDPGYMSADPQTVEADWVPPVDWEDGAGRVLWPVARGEAGEAVWGRVLRHYCQDVSGGL